MSTATLRSPTRNSNGSSTATASASTDLNPATSQRRTGTLVGCAFISSRRMTEREFVASPTFGRLHLHEIFFDLQVVDNEVLPLRRILAHEERQQFIAAVEVIH